MPGKECWDLTNTGQIGDTIGGTTAPFWGFLSIILLYLTLKEQIAFNKRQQDFNDNQQQFNESQQQFNDNQQKIYDYELLMMLRNDISELSNDIEFEICKHNYERLKQNGISKISVLAEIHNGSNANTIDEDDFEILFKKTKEIAELCLLCFNKLITSPLEIDIKKTFFRSVIVYSEDVCKLFNLCINRKVSINLNSPDEDVWERYSNQSNEYIDKFENVYEKLRHIGIRE